MVGLDMPKILDGNVERDMTEDEIAAMDLIKNGAEISIARSLEDEENRTLAKQAVLDRLGITADEARLLLL